MSARSLAAALLAACVLDHTLGDLGECAPGAVAPCGGERPGCARCVGATRRCDVNGRWGPCAVPAPTPLAELCGNGCDDDCNGLVDDCPRCVEVGATRACYTGPAATAGTGRCRAGVQRCDPLTQTFGGPCSDRLPALFERCGDGEDDDCDGQRDEGCAAPRVGRVVVGDATSCALVRGDGEPFVACWGDASWGLFGAADTTPRRRPARATFAAGATDVTLGAAHACAVVAGRVWCVGRNPRGELGDGSFDDRTIPVLARVPEGVVAVRAGRRSTCALLRDGAVWCWGDNTLGQAGGARCDRCPTPAPVDVSGANDLVVAFAHACARVAGGAVRCWGDAASTGATGGGRGAVQEVFAAGEAERVVAGDGATCALRGDGVRRCVGARAASAEAVASVPSAALAGGASWCAAGRDGTLRCSNEPWWETTDEAPAAPPRVEVAVSVPVAADVTSLAVGVMHACSLAGGQRVLCWSGARGAAQGQLGVGDMAPRGAPGAEVAW